MIKFTAIDWDWEREITKNWAQWIKERKRSSIYQLSKMGQPGIVEEKQNNTDDKIPV